MNAAANTYEARRLQFAPRTAQEITRAARELINQGLGDHTVAHILRMDVNALRQMVGPQA